MRSILLVVLLLCAPTFALSQTVKLKDLASFEGVRSNELVGYGLVVGLDGTGDSMRNSPFTNDTMANTLERLGVNVVGEQFQAKNVAAVIATATLPPFPRKGSRIDVTVSAIGDASSLRGGVLVMTALNAADGQVYAVAQGSIVASGLAAEGDAARTVQGVPTVGSIPAGGMIEQEIDFRFQDLAELSIALRTPDFSTAAAIEAAINRHTGSQVARMQDAGTVSLNLAAAPLTNNAQFIASIENIEVQPPKKARVVVDHRTGTIVMSETVRVSRVAVSKGNLTLTVAEQPVAVQPNPFAEGQTIVVPRSQVEIENDQVVALAEVNTATSLSDIVSGLNALGMTSNDLIDILKAIKAAGALHASLIIL